MGTEAGIAEKSKRKEQWYKCEQELDWPALFEMLLERNGNETNGKKQKHRSEYNEPGTLNRLGVWVSPPKECIDAFAAMASVFPESVLLSCLNIGPKFFEVAWCVHGCVPLG